MERVTVCVCCFIVGGEVWVCMSQSNSSLPPGLFFLQHFNGFRWSRQNRSFYTYCMKLSDWLVKLKHTFSLNVAWISLILHWGAFGSLSCKWWLWQCASHLWTRAVNHEDGTYMLILLNKALDCRFKYWCLMIPIHYDSSEARNLIDYIFLLLDYT